MQRGVIMKDIDKYREVWPYVQIIFVMSSLDVTFSDQNQP